MEKRHILNHIYNNERDRLKIENCFEIIEREVLEEEEKIEIRSFLYYHGDVLAVHIKREDLFAKRKEEAEKYEAEALFLTVRNYGTAARITYSISSWKIFQYWLRNNLNYRGTIERRDVSEAMGYYNRGGFYSKSGDETIYYTLGSAKEKTTLILSITKNY